jgi:hypothetical protein
LSPANNRVRYWISRSSGQTFVVRPKHSPSKGGSSSTANCAFPDRSREVGTFIVSTLNGQDPEMQLRELREYCQRRGITLIHEYVDTRISVAKDKRPELDRLLADAYRQRFDSVMVWRFDRFARSVSHLLRALETFRSLGIELVSLSE